MELIKFGNGPFQIYPVVKILKENDSAYEVICRNWEKFGYNLGLHGGEIEVLKAHLSSGNLELRHIPRELLYLWSDDVHEDDANLDVLYQALLYLKLDNLAATVRQKFGVTADGNEAVPAFKRIKREPVDETTGTDDIETETEIFSDGSPMPPRPPGAHSLLLAIREGRRVSYIAQLLEEGADVNVTTNDERANLVHVVIESLIFKAQSLKGALLILNLIMTKGFNLMNAGDTRGFTPLLHSMELEDMNEDLLEWFYKNGADFNAVEETGNSVLLQAIYLRQGENIIRKIIEYGGNIQHVNNWGGNALHMSARFGHVAALEIFIERLDVNGRDGENRTPMHLLFLQDDLCQQYQRCLEILLAKGADFNTECNQRFIPMVHWIMYLEDGGNPFPTLVAMKDQLPINQEIASVTLTVILEEMGTLQKFLRVRTSSKEAQIAFIQFFTFLVEEKEAKLKLKSETLWMRRKWSLLNKILEGGFIRELKKAGYEWEGELSLVKVTKLGYFDFHCTSGSQGISVPIEKVLVYLLACKHYKDFVEVCRFLLKFCQSVVVTS